MTLRVFAVIMLAASAICGAAQSQIPAAENSADNSEDISVEEALKRHNIALTQPALLQAIHDPDIEIRRLALDELVDQEATGAIPGIQEAFAAENIPVMRIYLAEALSKLGDSSATEWLEDTCEDASLPSDQRLEASTYLSSNQPDSCLGAVFDALEAADGDSAIRMWAMNLLTSYPHLSDAELQRSFTAILRGLASSDVS